jgi:hypothetical protein
LQACLSAQSTTPHPDIIHCTAYYIKSLKVKGYQVRINRVHTSKTYTHLQAEMLQDDAIRVSVRLVFALLPDGSGGKDSAIPSISYPHPMTRLYPIQRHPSQCEEGIYPQKFTYRNRVGWCEDRNFAKEKYEAKAATGEGGPEWAAWFTFRDSDEIVTSATL